MPSRGSGERSPASPPHPGHHHVNIPAAALGANQPSVPFRHWRLRTVPACLLGRIRFAPVATCFAPDHQPNLGRRGVTEGHRRTSVGLHLRRAGQIRLAAAGRRHNDADTGAIGAADRGDGLASDDSTGGAAATYAVVADQRFYHHPLKV
jgi:hypothetical protein